MDYSHNPKVPAGCQLNRILRDDNLRDLVIQRLPIKDTLTLARTCKEHRKLILGNRFDINAKLKRFNLDSIAFRTALGRSGALISGSFALQFLLGVVWKGTDLDVLVEAGTKMKMLDRFLVEKEGFAMASVERTGPSKAGGECRTYSKTSEDYGEAKIRLISCTSLPIQAILSESYTSCVMNFISWNKIYSIFPRTTFVDHETVPLSPQSNDHIPLLEKYRTRDFTVRNVVPQDGQGWDEARHRFVGDKQTWTLRLDTTGITPPEEPEFVLESCSFDMQYETRLSGNPGSHIVGDLDNVSIYDDYHAWCEPWRYIRICARTFTHPSLRYTYTDSNSTFFDRAFIDALDVQTREISSSTNRRSIVQVPLF
ncbi:hypothetical protein N0V93_009758 [Gnomoniopsis smithogilvyi]|uniref:F-box domain-containing protein n=1 Tax=Gnomoniopsis smithogilvyi TaxID=1191159 RepID=A0A9W9CSZ5_9PEZI|nr:hypothetical protein N0V93_009758 [Gnomoniopsis smithogilvyi]